MAANTEVSMLVHAVATARGDTLATRQCDLLAPENEYLDPNPDLHALFLEYNGMFFEGRLAGCEVKWSRRMTLCAGLCSFHPRSGFCSIRLSEPLLKLRPRSDMVNTLLHEMIHAYVFVATTARDHDDHGPLFQSHMHRINQAAKTQITVFHSFHDEVDAYRQHMWQCDGPCRRKPPYFGLVKRSMNRVPGPNDNWWADHERSCGGGYTKIKEPAEFTAKQTKKKEREQARAEKQKKKDEETKAAPSVRLFFPTVEEKGGNGKAKKKPKGDIKPPRTGKKALPQVLPANDSNKKRKKEADSGSNSPDIQALFQTAPTQPSNDVTLGARDRKVLPGSTTGTKSAVVDLTVSDSDASDTERGQVGTKRSSSTGVLSQATSEPTRTADPDVIEIE
ncbi:hypothetical protein PRIC2_006441 [Phytophthora ramorum]